MKKKIDILQTKKAHNKMFSGRKTKGKTHELCGDKISYSFSLIATHKLTSISNNNEFVFT